MSLLGVAVAGVLAVSGCSGSVDDPAAGPSGSPSSGSASASASPYLPVPDGVELTAQGSELGVGDDAVVAYEPRQKLVGVLDITVTRLEKTTFKKSFDGWQLDDATRKTNPYFVHATIKNVGNTDLGGRGVPLYIVDGANTLIESSRFASTFEPCPSQAFPKKFKGGDKTKVCLVYLSPDHGDLTAVSFRPSQEFDPITWTGELETPKADGSKKGEKGKGKGEKGKGGKGKGGKKG
ncbi:MAG: hypothetical protein JWO76_3189 [Nocardioides sp.]|nr:hypothetical protein [Nocardioides sp.]